MPRQASVAVDNNFKQGLVTQATGLNFPPNACTETFNCEFNFDGSVQRRLGFDYEHNFINNTINRTDRAISTYLWRNVAGNGDVSVAVAQIGLTIFFYRIIFGAAFSGGISGSTVTLTPVAGAAANAQGLEVQYSDGNGFLFVTHPYCDPVRISYDINTDNVVATTITIQIRDFEGATADPFAVDERPTSSFVALNANHLYNLLNQGWNAVQLAAWDTAQPTMPSNSDIMWRFRNATDDIDFSNPSLARVITGNTPAPKGHFVMPLTNQNRDLYSGTVGVASTTTGSQRPSVSAFFAGRVFYAGINFIGYNSKIYFTQIVERDTQYGNCYQVNDPSSQDLFDLLPNDGGVISIPDAGTIYKLIAVPGGLGVFAANGVWFISGSSGIGFSATDYTVQRVALIPTLSATSFVNVGGYPAWWNAEGIYIFAPSSDGGGGTFGQGSQLPVVKSLTYSTIKDFYDQIPLSSKRFARGAFDRLNGRIKWIYRTGEATEQVNSIYEFDGILNFNINTGAFYPWTIADFPVKINSILIADAEAGSISVTNVTVNGGVDNVQDNSGNDVIIFTASGAVSAPTTKYLISYPDTGTHQFSWAENITTTYRDWFSFNGDGINFDSYFITGFKILGQAIQKFQSNWVRVFSRTEEDVSYHFQSIWDYAATGSGTGRWSVKQLINHTDTDYTTSSKRLKVRGHGLAMQFKVSSLDGEPFDIVGWSAQNSVNQLP